MSTKSKRKTQIQIQKNAEIEVKEGECSHLRNTSEDPGLEGVNQVVEVGERVKLEQEMGHPTCGTHQNCLGI